jgi:glycosyltransferase involved in cell wall biosynthesis
VLDGSLTLVVPLYNEAARFDRFAAELAAFVARQPAGSELLFVDDGSTDDTVTLVEKFLASPPRCRARLLRRPHLGKGGAL